LVKTVLVQTEAQILIKKSAGHEHTFERCGNDRCLCALRLTNRYAEPRQLAWCFFWWLSLLTSLKKKMDSVRHLSLA